MFGFDPSILALDWIGAPLFATLFTVASYATSLAMQYLLNKKKSNRKQDLTMGTWNGATLQRAGIPLYLVYGTAKVVGNAISQHTTPRNVVGVPNSNLLAYLWLSYQDPNGVMWDVAEAASMSTVYWSFEGMNTKIALSDGPVLGLKSEYTRLNKKLLSGLTDVTTTEKFGTDSQTATDMENITQFPGQETVGSLAQIGREMVDSDYDDCAIILTSQEGLCHYDVHTGKMMDQWIGVMILIREIGGAWHTLACTALFGHTTKPVYWRFKASGTYYQGTPFTVTKGVRHEWCVWNVRQSVSQSSLGKLEIWGTQQIYNTAYKYPGLAYFEIQDLPATQLGGTLDFEGVLDGKIVEDCETGALAWSDNPANVIQDLLCRPCIKGTGESADPYEVEYYRGYQPSDLNTADFTALKDWCDELVSDGKGSTEKRFRFGGQFTAQAERWEQAAKVTAMCRANLWYDGKQVRIWIDKTTTASHLFCSANMFASTSDGGSNPDSIYKETSVDTREIPGIIEADISNELAGYEEAHVKKVDRTSDNDHMMSIDGTGTPSISQFVRLADFLFDKFNNLKLRCQFSTDVNGLDAKIGQVAYVQSDVNGRAVGAVVTAATLTSVTLDKPLTMDSGLAYTLVVQTINATGKHVNEYTVTSLTGSYTANISGSLSYIPIAGDCCIFGESTKIDKYRITEIKYGADGGCNFVCEQYLAAYYSRDAGTPSYDTNLYITAPAKGSSSWQPVTREELGTQTEQDSAGVTNEDQVSASGITFVGDGVDTVTWTASVDDDDTDFSQYGWINLNGLDYPIHPDATGTTKRYIYFDGSTDSSNDPTYLKTTDDLADLRGYSDRYLGCINDNGRAIPKGWILVGADSYLDINGDDIVQGVRGNNAFMETFEDPNGDIADRWINYGGSGELTIQAGGESGASYLQVGNNSGNDMANLVYRSSIAFDPGLTYRVRIRVRQSAGTGTVYAGLAGRNAMDNAWVNINGADSLSSQHFMVAVNQTVPGDWTEYTGYVRGTAATGEATVHSDMNDPAKMHTDVRWIRPMIIVNYNGQAGICDIDTFSIDVVSGADGLGSMAYQDADAVAITGGTVEGLTKLGVNGGAFFETEIQNYPESGASSITIDWTLGNKQCIPALDGDYDLVFVNPLGAAHLNLRVVQTTGGNTLTLPAGTLMINGNAFELSTGAGAEDLIMFYYPGPDSGAVYRCSVAPMSAP